MQNDQTYRIRIDDLPPLEQLTEEELALIFGAGRLKPKQLSMESLEPRQLTAVDIMQHVPSPDRTLGGQDSRSAGKEIVFIDSRVEDYASLLAGSEVDEFVVLKPDRNGVEQMAEYLHGRAGIEAIHILSHGTPGGLLIGDSLLDLLAAADRDAPELQALGTSLAPGTR